MEGAFPRSCDRPAGDDEPERGVEPDIYAADDGVDREVRRQKVGTGNIDGVAGGAIDHPSRAAKTAIGRGGTDGAISRFGGADPALLVLRCDDVEFMTGSVKSVNQFMEEHAFNPVVVGDQKSHRRRGGRVYSRGAK